MKTKIISVKISEEQEQILMARTRSAGFLKKSNYVRFTLFMSMPIEDKINQIYEKVCKNG